MRQLSLFVLLGLALKTTAKVCPRPGGWCVHKGTWYSKKMDCDGDGKVDPFCQDTTGRTGYRSSKHGCRETWSQGRCLGLNLAEKKKALPCDRPRGWCVHKGSNYDKKKDCDGDFIPDHYCKDRSKRGFILSGFACKRTWGSSQKCDPPRIRAITPSYYNCANRAGLGGNNKYSINVGNYNLRRCIAYVHSQKDCGNTFEYGLGDGWCSCVKQGRVLKNTARPFNLKKGKATVPCNMVNLPNPNLYSGYTIMGRTVQSPLNLIAEGYLCQNRGSVGGKGGYSKKVGAGKNALRSCAAYVASNKNCGPFFNLGLKDGYCDCVPVRKGQCKLWTDANTQNKKYAVFSQVAKKITIGRGSRKTKCVHYKDVVCPKNAGDRYIRVNTDYRNAGDRFRFTYSKNKICAHRLDRNHGWGMNLQIMCEFKDVSAYQAKFVTTAPNHLCENRGSAGGKNKKYSKNAKAKNLPACLAWVAKNKNCGPHFSYGWKDGWCDCVPKGKGMCKIFTDKNTIKQQYGSYEIYTTTTTPPPPTPAPKPKPRPKPLSNLKAAKGWKVSKGKCTIDISTGLVCAVSSNYPKPYRTEELCEFTLSKQAKKHAPRVDIEMNGERYFDYLKIDGKQYHGSLQKKVPLKSNKITWTADFYESSKGRRVGFKLCEAKKRRIDPVPIKWVKKRITIGRSGRNKKCAHGPGVRCPGNAGNRGRRVNSDYRNANDRFRLTYTRTQVCARRLDSRGGWGMNLQMMCKKKKR